MAFNKNGAGAGGADTLHSNGGDDQRSYNKNTGESKALPNALKPLTELKCWVVWKWETVNDKRTKVPYQTAHPNKKASIKRTANWSSYTEAVAAVADPANKLDGIGFTLLNSEVGAFDLDDCRDPATGDIEAWASDLVARSGSYAEITISGTGLRIIGYASGAEIHRKQPVDDGGTLETYRSAVRFIVITGNVLQDAALADLNALMEAEVAKLDAGKREQSSTSNVDELDDVIRNGGGERWEGDRSRAVWFVVNELLRRGYYANAIVAVLLDRDNKISDHIYDQAKPSRYAANQVNKALQAIGFLTNDSGKPIAHRADNIRVALLKLGVTVRHDKFAERILLDGLTGFGPVLDDAAVNHLWLTFAQRFHFTPNRELTQIVISDTALLNSFHPVVDYLAGLKWDGVKRLDKWLVTYAGAEDTKYTRAVGALTLIAAVRRVRKPGCKFDEMLVLEQPAQGTDKSSALKVLAVSEDWFSDDLPLNVEGKRVIEAIRGRWIVEAAELSGMKKADVEHLKATLSRQVDRARMAWGRLPIEAPRQSIIIGTTNKLQYLRDTSGNRRFWPVLIVVFKIAELRRDRDQLWAEAAAREAKGESIRLARELWPAAASEQQQRLSDDPFVDVLARHLGDKEGKIRAVDVWTILDLRGGQLTQENYQRAAEAMRRIGWKRPNKAGIAKFHGKVMAAYVRGNNKQILTAYRDHERLIVEVEKPQAKDGMCY